MTARWSEDDLTEFQRRRSRSLAASNSLSPEAESAPENVSQGECTAKTAIVGRKYGLVVYGAAQPAGSKQAFVPLHPKTKEPYRNKSGGIIVSVVDDNKRSKDWKRLVAKIAREECGAPMLTGPVRVTMVFYRERPQSHLATVGLNKAGRETPFPITKPDAGKLARGTIDAMTGVIYKDDAQIIEEIAVKRYGSPARVEIVIEELLVPDPNEQPELFQDVPPWEKGGDAREQIVD